jgi:hypothetical protein
MNAITLLKKIKKLKRSTFTVKRVALFFINRRLAKYAKASDFGSITDLRVDREGRTLAVESSRNGAITTIVIRNYRFSTEKNSSYLRWQHIDISGPQRREYLAVLSATSRIEVPKSSIKYLEAML